MDSVKQKSSERFGEGGRLMTGSYVHTCCGVFFSC